MNLIWAMFSILFMPFQVLGPVPAPEVPVQVQIQVAVMVLVPIPVQFQFAVQVKSQSKSEFRPNSRTQFSDPGPGFNTQ